jgi:hypothetical protein
MKRTDAFQPIPVPPAEDAIPELSAWLRCLTLGEHAGLALNTHHAALSAIHGVNVLLTWNCTHLANEHMIPLIGRACEAYGYAPPVILTPEQLIGVCAYGRSGS